MNTKELVTRAVNHADPKVLRGTVPAGMRAGYPIAILTAMRKLKYGFPYTMWEPVRRTPRDKTPRLPQAIQYPPGMGPRHGLSEDLGPHAGKTIEKRRFETYEGIPAAIILAPSKPKNG